MAAAICAGVAEFVNQDAQRGVRVVNDGRHEDLERAVLGGGTRPARADLVAPIVETGGSAAAGATAERNRAKEIGAIADRLAEKIPTIRKAATEAIDAGMSVETFRARALDMLPESQPIALPKLDVKPKDWQRYSIARAISGKLPASWKASKRKWTKSWL